MNINHDEDTKYVNMVLILEIQTKFDQNGSNMETTKTIEFYLCKHLAQDPLIVRIRGQKSIIVKARLCRSTLYLF